MPADPLVVSVLTARRFACRAVGLDEPFGDVASAIDHLAYIQIDPINVCGRMHDLILRNRVAGYREGDLMRHLHGREEILPAGQRTAFEHYLPDAGILTAFPLSAWPHLLSAMRQRTERDGAWSGRLTAEEERLVEPIFEEMARRGPISSSHLEDRGSSRSVVWGSATIAKSALQKLCFHGRVLIARREGNRRLYDLPERVLPASTLALREPTAEETARWQVLTKLRQRRLALLKRNELLLVADEVQALTIQDADMPTLHCLREDVPLLERCADPGFAPAGTPMLLAPLDPLIYDRRVTSGLWGFDYIWEVYTPPHKRTRGYYALPVLSGHELVGHVDPKADTKAKTLTVVSRSVRRGHAVAPAVKSLAAFLGLR